MFIWVTFQLFIEFIFNNCIKKIRFRHILTTTNILLNHYLNCIYLISKLLLNTLFGRLGMDPTIKNHIIIDSNDSKFYEIYNKNIFNINNLNNGKELIFIKILLNKKIFFSS